MLTVSISFFFRRQGCSIRPQLAHGALRLSCARVRYRALSPEDPFGERSTWEDPIEGMYAGWKDVDQAAFAAAADSDEVRQAHFGPEWSRFSVVGRLAVQKARDRSLAPSPEAGSPPYPSAEESHARDLERKKKLLENNFASYSDFVEHELAVGGTDVKDGSVNGSGGGASNGAVSPVEEDFCGGPKAEISELVPAFVRNAGGLAVNMTEAAPRFHMSSLGQSDIISSSATNRTPNENLLEIARALPFPHGDPRLPLTDPFEWDSSAVVAFLELFEQRPLDQASVMDDTMRDAFFMAGVNGQMLVHHIAPPHLFRVMRRWHLRRQALIHEVCEALSQRKGGTGAGVSLVECAAQVIAEKGTSTLDDAVCGLSVTVIQETILGSFVYGR